MIELKIDPVAKPRMTQSDVWKHRPVIDRYYAFKDHLKMLCNLQNFVLPEKYRVEFYIKIPDSWSNSKRRVLEGQPHKSKPDLDNLIKSVNDCLLVEDSVVWYVEASKIWWPEGKIVFYNIK